MKNFFSDYQKLKDDLEYFKKAKKRIEILRRVYICSLIFVPLYYFYIFFIAEHSSLLILFRVKISSLLPSNELSSYLILALVLAIIAFLFPVTMFFLYYRSTQMLAAFMHHLRTKEYEELEKLGS